MSLRMGSEGPCSQIRKGAHSDTNVSVMMDKEACDEGAERKARRESHFNWDSKLGPLREAT